MEAKRAQMVARLEQRKKASQKPKPANPQEVVNSDFETNYKSFMSLFLDQDEISFAENVPKANELLDSNRKLLAEASSLLSGFHKSRANTKMLEMQQKLSDFTTKSLECPAFNLDQASLVDFDEIDARKSLPKTQNGNEFKEDFQKAKATPLVKYSDLIDQIIEIDSKTVHDFSDVSLENLKNCIIKIHIIPSALFANNLNCCKLISLPVSTSVMLENCQSSKFYLACQQLRIHSSKQCQIYCHVTSKAIIEHCNELSFSEYLPNITVASDVGKYFEKAGLNMHINNWKNVNDFDWPLKRKASPNWKPMQDNEISHEIF